VTRYNSGCIVEEILILDVSTSKETWIHAVEADQFLRVKQKESKEQSFINRVITRLTGPLEPVDGKGKPLEIKSLEDISLLNSEQKRIVRMSQNAYNAFVGVPPNGAGAGDAGGDTEAPRAPPARRPPPGRGGRGRAPRGSH